MNYCVVDFESSCWPDGLNHDHQMEIIEFAAVMIDSNFMTLGSFDMFVKPKLNPILTPFCTQLTSIRQYDVDMAQGFPVVYKAFVTWLQGFKPVTFGSWGLYDKKQLTLDCLLHGVPYPFNDIHLNLKNIWAGAAKHKRCGLTKAVNFLNLEFIGTKHRGIDDVANIIAVCRKSNVPLDDAVAWAQLPYGG